MTRKDIIRAVPDLPVGRLDGFCRRWFLGQDAKLEPHQAVLIALDVWFRRMCPGLTANSPFIDLLHDVILQKLELSLQNLEISEKRGRLYHVTVADNRYIGFTEWKEFFDLRTNRMIAELERPIVTIVSFDVRALYQRILELSKEARDGSGKSPDRHGADG